MDQETKRQIAAFLPGALATAVESYESFSRRAIEMEPKKFSDHHGACKAAIAHIDLLIKFSCRIMESNDIDAGSAQILKDRIDRAQAELATFHQDLDDA